MTARNPAKMEIISHGRILGQFDFGENISPRLSGHFSCVDIERSPGSQHRIVISANYEANSQSHFRPFYELDKFLRCLQSNSIHQESGRFGRRQPALPGKVVPERGCGQPANMRAFRVISLFVDLAVAKESYE